MKSPNFQEIWEGNKKFLLGTGGALLVFLLLFSWIGDYRTDAQDYQNKYRRERGGIQNLYRTVRSHYHESSHRVEDLEKLEQDLLQSFSPGGQVDVMKALDSFKGSSELYFSDQIEKIWSEVRTKKTRRSLGCELPSAIKTSELGVSSDDLEEDSIRHQKYLAILRRALNVLIDSGMKQIGKPRLHTESVYGIQKNPGYEVVFQRMTIRVRGPFAAFSGVFEELQKSASGESGVQALLLDLRPAKKEGGGLVGDLEFASFSVGEAVEDRTDSPKKRRGGKKSVRERR